MPRNFICPDTAKPCERPDCRVNECVDQALGEAANAMSAKEIRARYLQTHPGEMTLDDLGL
jgi:hypothetical protein